MIGQVGIVLSGDPPFRVAQNGPARMEFNVSVTNSALFTGGLRRMDHASISDRCIFNGSYFPSLATQHHCRAIDRVDPEALPRNAIAMTGSPKVKITRRSGRQKRGVDDNQDNYR